MALIRQRLLAISASLSLIILVAVLIRQKTTTVTQALSLPDLRHQEVTRIPLDDIDRSIALWGLPQHIISEGPQYLQQYKNPCWRDVKAENEILCLPYVYQLGVAKGGTRTMYRLTAKHPDVAGPMRKEPHFWERIEMRPVFKTGFLPVFKNATGAIHRQVDSAGYHRKVTIEASPGSFSKLADYRKIPGNLVNGEVKYSTAHSLYALNPKTKLIVVLRDPASRLYSHYHGISKFHGDFSPESFHNKSVARLATINDCLTTRPMRSCIFDEKVFPDQLKSREFGGELSFHYSLYYPFAVEWLKVFPREQLLFVKSEEMYADSRATMKRVFEFLELPEASEDLYEEIHQFTSTYTQQPKVVRRLPYRTTMLKKTRDLLNKFFKPYNTRLAELLGDRKWLFS